MRTVRERRLVVVACIAVGVELVSVVGWWSWGRLARVLESAPVEGAEMLAQSLWLRLPSAVRRSRRMPARNLGQASEAVVIPALHSLGRGQIRWTPVDSNGFKNRARALLIEGLYDEAATELELALMRDPTSPELYRLSALNERARGWNEQTLDHLATADGLASGAGRGVVELVPEDADWIRLEGLKRRLVYYPRLRVPGVIALAAELRRRGEAERGRELLEELIDDPRIALEVAKWDLESGLTVSGETRLTGLLRRAGLTDSLRAQAWTLMATARDQSGDPEGALAAANEALVYDPRSAGPYRVLARLAERRGDSEAALGHLRLAWGMNPTDVNLLLNVASTAQRAGHYDDARLALERAMAVEPDNVLIRARLVEFQIQRGQYMEATLNLSAALDRFPTDPRLLRLADRLRAEVNRSRQ